MDAPSSEAPSVSWKTDSIDPNLETAVSWHADSSLEHYSTIAVYQTLVRTSVAINMCNVGGSKDKDNRYQQPANNQWLVGLRVAPHAEGPTSGNQRLRDATTVSAPPLAVTLPSNSCYYMLHDFNHHHQHAVFVDRSTSTRPHRRYSCTFRCLRSQSHTVQELLERCRRTCQLFHKRGSRIWRAEQLLLTEIESDWLRQYYIQKLSMGCSSATSDWTAWIEELWKYWSRLEHRTGQVVQLLLRASRYEGSAALLDGDTSTTTGFTLSKKERDKQRKAHQTVQTILDREKNGKTEEQLREILAVALDERATMREHWRARENDRMFAQVGYQPRPFYASFCVSDPSCPRSSPLFSNSRVYATSLRNAPSHTEPNTPDIAVLLEETTGPQQWALEVQEPWSRKILDGSKSIETRQYDLPSGLLGRRLYLLETPSGTTGKSNLEDYTVLSSRATKGNRVARIIGWIQISSVVKYTNSKQFYNDEALHLVGPTSGYGWETGTTKTIYGWKVEERCEADDTDLFFAASRRKRSIFELHPSSFD